jgi:hypothetical protein
MPEIAEPLTFDSADANALNGVSKLSFAKTFAHFKTAHILSRTICPGSRPANQKGNTNSILYKPGRCASILPVNRIAFGIYASEVNASN